MALATLLLAVHLRVDLIHLIRLRRERAQPAVQMIRPTCAGRVVGFRFEGAENQKLELSGVTYIIGREQFIELLSSGETTYQYEGKTLPLTVWPTDTFGFLRVPLPKPAGRRE